MSVIRTDIIKPGMTVGSIEFVRLVTDGEVYLGQEIMNKRENKWWAKIGNDERMICLDALTPKDISRLEGIREWPKEPIVV
jgi:hypothetical protein